ncbi:MAG: hypothetical protein PHP82_04135 [Candidatus ainarchaeum sp.]|nr:hypothetical protein [Candidatus ainarchaeum sp.]
MMELKSFNKGQTTIELLLVLCTSLIVLILIYSLYAEQVESSNVSNDFFIAKISVQKIVNGVNTAYLSGIGSKVKIEVEFPKRVDFENSSIFSNIILLKMFDGSDIMGISDVNIEGSIRPQYGKQVFYLFFDGNVVKLQYLDFELNQYSISFSTNPNTNRLESFSLRNNSSQQITFIITKNFSHTQVTLDMNTDSFILQPNEIKSIDLNFNILSNASGNYSGNIIINSQTEDSNMYKSISLSVESLLLIEEIMIYPLVTNFTTIQNTFVEKNFSICNKSDISINDITWSGSGQPDNNIISWITNWDDLLEITSINSGSCEEVTLEFEILNFDFNTYYGSIISNYINSFEVESEYEAFIEISVVDSS